MRQRHALYLSAAMTERLTLMVETHRLSKSEILKRALQAYLTQDADGRPFHLLAQRKGAAKDARAPGAGRGIRHRVAGNLRGVLPDNHPAPAGKRDQRGTCLGQQRYQQAIAGIARRLKTDRHLTV
jgi:Ribbon-helix-helix protein, copG family